ncbi:MAG TPA: siderophore-interacting protein, partial [Acidimicrobiales bacterium]|nr:siderophore-interacting protein [Acidimicrobiales bacterium]
MSEQEASPGERWRPTPETIATAERMGTAALALEVVGVAEGGGFRRVSFHEPQLGAVEYHPGQDLTFSVPAGVDRSVKRRYTIRNLDRSAARADVEVVLHGDG